MERSDDDVVYRRFNASAKSKHLAAKGEGNKFRISTTLFKDSNGVSIDDGALSTPEQSWAREECCGLVSVPKSLLAQEGIAIEPKPETENPAHCEIGDLKDGQAKRVTKSITILFAPPGVNGDQNP